jgi:hypothetical protein
MPVFKLKKHLEWGLDLNLLFSLYVYLNFKKLTMKKLLVLTVMAGLVLSACNREDEVKPDPVMSSSTDMVCKFTVPLKGESPGPNQTCVMWEYTEEGTLLLTHYNAGFNCCPEKILTSMQISGDTIIITERDSLQLCRCNCLYDIDFVIENVEQANYVIRFDEPFVTDPKQPLQFVIDLDEASSGKYCEYRDYYPWGE